MFPERMVQQFPPVRLPESVKLQFKIQLPIGPRSRETPRLRQLYEAMKELERVQATRKAKDQEKTQEEGE
jgi:hypothetical protein